MIPDLVVKATVLLGIAWIAALLLRSRAASTRHAVWAGLMAATLLLPIMVSFAPTIDVPVLPANAGARATRITPVQVGPNELAIVTDRGGKQDARSRVILAEGSASSQQPAPVTEPSILTSRNLLLGAWLLVALALALRIVISHVQARSLLRICEDPSDRLVRAAAAIAASLGVKAPALRIAPEGLMPAVIGLRNPAIVLPSEASSWSDERLQAVLLHECAHVRRRDAIMQLVSGLATAAYWWHPLAWIAARHIVRERELACDDVVIASGMPGDTYAGHLLDIARSLKTSRQPSLAALAMARPSQLEGRLIALLETRRRDPRPARALTTGLVLGVLGLAAIAPLKLVARAVTGENLETSQVTSQDSVAGPQTQNTVPPPPPVRADGGTRPQMDAKLFEAIQKALKDMDASVREMAVVAVAANTEEYARLIALLGPMIDDVSADVRGAVVSSLLKADAPQAGPLLLKALDDPDPDVRQMALAGLVRLQREELIPHLAGLLKDASEDVRSMAVLGIDMLEHPQKDALLLQAVADISEDVRTLVAFALADENGQDVSAAIAKLVMDGSADVRQAAVMAMASKRRSVDMQQLIASLRDRDADVRAAAAMGLGSIADKAATAALAQALSDAHADVRSAAAIALGAIGDAASLQALTAAVSDVDADVRKSAITAAASIGGDWKAQTVITSTIAGTVAGTIAGTLHGTLWGGHRGDFSGWVEPQREVHAERQSTSENNSVYVTGPVRNGGEFRWRENLTVGKLIAEAGGVTERGTLSGLSIRRRSGGRTETIEAKEDTVLLKGDYLVVRERRF